MLPLALATGTSHYAALLLCYAMRSADGQPNSEAKLTPSGTCSEDGGVYVRLCDSRSHLQRGANSQSPGQQGARAGAGDCGLESRWRHGSARPVVVVVVWARDL